MDYHNGYHLCLCLILMPIIILLLMEHSAWSIKKKKKKSRSTSHVDIVSRSTASTGCNLVDAAVTSGVKHMVHLSTYNKPNKPSVTLVSHYRWHDLVEKYIEQSGLRYTHMRANVSVILIVQVMYMCTTYAYCFQQHARMVTIPFHSPSARVCKLLSPAVFLRQLARQRLR